MKCLDLQIGIVSQICDEIGIKEVIDKLIPPDPQMILSHGENRTWILTVKKMLKRR